MAEAIVSIVVGRLNDLLIEDAQLLHGVKDEIEEMVNKLMRIKTFLQDADSRLTEHKIRILLAGIRELAYDAEHAVESFLLKASSTKNLIQWMNKSKFSRKIKDIQRRMPLISNSFLDYNIRSTLEAPESSNTSSGTPGKLKRFYSYATPEPEIFVGFHEDVDRLVGHLVNESDDCYPLISICGMGGLGKTTLAQKIYNHSTIKKHFAGNLAWVSISQKWQTKLVLQRILIGLVPENRDNILTMDDDKLVENLLQVQQRKKCLIVLDDIWKTEAWDSLKAAFTSESKLMLTSRNVAVAEHVNAKGFIHKPKLLSADESWELLRLKALPKGDYLDARDVKKMEELGREMVGNCAGLPLAIVVLGGILVTKPSLTEWEKVHYDSRSSLKRRKGLGEDHQREVLDVLIWSYNDLPPQLKPCFLYLGKFREDELIQADTLYQLLIAEGIVLSSDKREGETMIQVAESYLAELVHKSMVKVKFNDEESSVRKFRFCSLHDLMRDLSISQAKVEGFFNVIELREGNDFHLSPVDFTSPYTRLVIFFDEKYTSKKANNYFVKKADQQRYRSMLLFTESSTLPSIIGSHVANFKLLRVLAFEDVHLDRASVSVSGILFHTNLGRVLSRLVYLRYLSVRKTHLLMFPSIQNLVLLQTLKLDGICYPPWLSRNILGKLGRLRHLYLPDEVPQTLLGKNKKLRFNGLSKLETLENFNPSWCEVKDLPKLISLHKLRIQLRIKVDVEEMMKYLIALLSSSCLLELSLLITCDLRMGNGPDILRQLLWDHNYGLHELFIDGELPELGQLFDWQQLHNTHIDVSLIRITSIYLLNSELEEDPMPVLEKIPTLHRLYISQEVFKGKEMVCSATGFPKLTSLHLRYLYNLEKWSVEKGSMPILSFLTINSCPKLEELPEGLLFHKSLQTLKVCEMPSEFCNKVSVAHVPSLIFY